MSVKTLRALLGIAALALVSIQGTVRISAACAMGGKCCTAQAKCCAGHSGPAGHRSGLPNDGKSMACCTSSMPCTTPVAAGVKEVALVRAEPGIASVSHVIVFALDPFKVPLA